MSETPALDPMRRFTDRAEDYRRHRPSYPREAIDAALEGLGDPAGLTAADVGAGTGISARLLADRGVRVFAVEPNEAMRDAADPHEGITWLNGTAGATGLGDNSVDLVLCAQAFHWFDADAAVREFARILRPGGRLALMWNVRDRSDPFTDGYCRTIAEVIGQDPAEQRPLRIDAVERSGHFGPVRVFETPNAQRLDLDGLLGRAMSASYTPKEGPGAERLTGLLRGLHARHSGADGRVDLVYRVRVYLCERT